MKKLTICLVAFFVSLTFIPTQVNAAAAAVHTPIAPRSTADSLQAIVLISRLNEIKVMDKSNLNASEKKELRAETRSIKKNLRQIGGGVYLSAGAVIIIVLLLLFLL